jgi:hypothetical protein
MFGIVMDYISTRWCMRLKIHGSTEILPSYGLAVLQTGDVMGHDKAQLIVGALESRLLQMNFKWRQELLVRAQNNKNGASKMVLPMFLA